MVVSLFTIKTKGAKSYWDVRKLASNVKWTTDVDYSAGQLTFDLVETNEGFTPKNGDEVRFWWNDAKTFYGRIFDVKYTSDEKFSVTAYDNLRYLKNEDTLVFPSSTLTQRFNQVCQLAKIPHKAKVVTKHKLSPVLNDDKSYFDMLKSSIKEARKANGNHYFVADHYGTVELRKAPYYRTKIILGDKSSAESFTFEKSIDNAYNAIKVVKTSKKEKAKVTATKIVQANKQGNTLQRWGKLQKIEKVTKDKTNLAQMKVRASNLLKLYNRQTYKLSINCTGNQALRAGNSAYVKLASLKEIGLGTKQLVITKSTITFDPNYTADLEIKVRMS